MDGWTMEPMSKRFYMALIAQLVGQEEKCASLGFRIYRVWGLEFFFYGSSLYENRERWYFCRDTNLL